MDGDLFDFCQANFGASATEIIRQALRAFIDEHLENEPRLKDRFERARKKRLGESENLIQLVNEEE